MTAAFMLSIACRTAVPAQSPSAIRRAFALSSRLESPTAPGSTAWSTASSASSNETRAPVLVSVGRARPECGDESRPDRRLVGGVQRRPPVRREDAQDPALLGTQHAALDEALEEPAADPLPETRHDALGPLALLLPRDGQRLVQQAVAGRAGVPDDQPALADPLVGAGDVDALQERELHQQGAAESHVHLGARRRQLAGVVVGEEEQQVLGEEHETHARQGGRSRGRDRRCGTAHGDRGSRWRRR